MSLKGNTLTGFVVCAETESANPSISQVKPLNGRTVIALISYWGLHYSEIEMKFACLMLQPISTPNTDRLKWVYLMAELHRKGGHVFDN